MTQEPSLHTDFPEIADFLEWWLQLELLSGEEKATFDRYYRGYRHRFNTYIRTHYNNQVVEANRVVASKPGLKLLEVGAGCGTESLWFAMQGADVLAIDVNAERLATAKRRKEILEQHLGRSLNIEYRYCSFFDLEGHEDFDMIWMEQAFHHIEPRTQIYAKIEALLKPQGHVVISEANAWNFLVQAKLFRKRGFKTVVDKVTPEGDRILYGNERILTAGRLASDLQKVGIEKQSVRFFRSLPNVSWADRFLPFERCVPQAIVPFFSHYNYVGRKK